MTWRRALLALIGLAVVGAVIVAAQGRCWSTWIRYGVDVQTCPAGRMRAQVHFRVSNLRRGSPGRVMIRPFALYTVGWSRGASTTPIHRGAATLTLYTKTSTLALTPKDGWSRDGEGTLVGSVTLPADLPDGQHRLTARVETPLGLAEATMPLAVFAPAKVMVMSDRPLYEAGNLVQFRAVVLRSRDQVPLDGRPGEWIVTAPDGTRVLQESAAAGAYGVVAGDFPLDESAETGVWIVEWRSGADSGRRTFRVEPFELPRFTVQASSVRPFYGRRSSPVVRGTVTYASGAPVADAAVEIDWRVSGAWPPPTSWTEGALPTRSVADAQGGFELRLPRVPVDLMGQVRLIGTLAATDSTGDRVYGGVSVLLAQDKIVVTPVTELADGLVEGFNNRLYLRATTASGAVLGGTQLKVTRAWDPADEGQTVTTDVDGVAVVQIDPGPAVTVVEPGLPIRPPRPRPAVERASLSDHLRSAGPALADQLVFDKVPLAACARLAQGRPEVRSLVWASAAGRVDSVISASDDLGQCVQAVLKKVAFGPGRTRLFEVIHRFHYDGPTVDLLFFGPDTPPSRWRARMEQLAITARSCLPAKASGRPVGRLLGWTLDRRGAVDLRAIAEPRVQAKQPSKITDCLIGALKQGAARTLAELGDTAKFEPATGLVRIGVSPAPSLLKRPR
ncbi:MAG: MG2 domain-containing protein, partial [Myxococcota bacterium]